MPTQQQIDATTEKLASAQGLSAGERVYVDNCTACHFVTGAGAPTTFPPLAGSQIVNAENPTALISVILNGAQLPSTPNAPSQLMMPDFGWRLNDQQVADLATFLRGAWGNDGPNVRPREVREVRRNLPAPAITSEPKDLD